MFERLLTRLQMLDERGKIVKRTAGLPQVFPDSEVELQVNVTERFVVVIIDTVDWKNKLYPCHMLYLEDQIDLEAHISAGESLTEFDITQKSLNNIF